ncbi:hypothetical protein PpBr36_03764 [Pyricularia pennisetigena]|uniref:hypothetical protein n=1 Tax=Pyricularia pennisetigena TaxID=1578925 RepID=UPI00114E0A5E|nr:hypothetical protein PpBr36_03764 [Pyricularia pennisetigena]TLS31158.1 hypothetical protein PpBr36_03764 [Pyricularia pennisetigena]
MLGMPRSDFVSRSSQLGQIMSKRWEPTLMGARWVVDDVRLGGTNGVAAVRVDARDATDLSDSVRDRSLESGGERPNDARQLAKGGTRGTLERAGNSADEGESSVDLGQQGRLGGSELTSQARKYRLGLGQELGLSSADAIGHLAEDSHEVAHGGAEVEGVEERAQKPGETRNDTKVEGDRTGLPGNERIATDQSIAGAGLEIQRGGNGGRGRGEKNGELGELHVC